MNPPDINRKFGHEEKVFSNRYTPKPETKIGMKIGRRSLS